MKNARGREMKCQEASTGFPNMYVPCGSPAEVIVDNGDHRPYWMCLGCASHNKANRGAVIYFVKDKA